MTGAATIGDGETLAYKRAQLGDGLRNMTVLRYGVTLDQMHRLAGVCARRTFRAPRNAGEYIDRFETAWSGIAEHLYATQTPPTDDDLIRAGRQAIVQSLEADLRHWGLARRGAEIRSRVRFEAYWRHHAGAVPSPEERVIERIAARQILRTLTASDRRLLAVLVAAQSAAATADALGVGTRDVSNQVARIRARFRRLWLEHESPQRRQWRRQGTLLPKDRLAPCGTTAAVRRHRYRGEPLDDRCRRAEAESRLRRSATAKAVYTSLGTRLRQLRGAREMTQAGLADALRIDMWIISRLERGVVLNPNRDIVRRIDAALGAAGELVALLDAGANQ